MERADEPAARRDSSEVRQIYRDIQALAFCRAPEFGVPIVFGI